VVNSHTLWPTELFQLKCRETYFIYCNNIEHPDTIEQNALQIPLHSVEQTERAPTWQAWIGVGATIHREQGN
jgi:hypothetical protein